MNYAIIAAGLGERLASEGIIRPKPLVEIDGVPMIERLIDIFTHCDAERIRVVTNSTRPEVARYVGSLNNMVPIEVMEASTPSSMHSLAALNLGSTGLPWCVTTVDTIFRPSEFRAYIDAWHAAPCDALMGVTTFVDDEKPLYVDVDPEGKITAFRDERNPATTTHVSGGIYTLSPRALQVLDQCLAQGTERMRNYQRALIENGLDVRAFEFSKIIDVDHPADILTAETIIHNQ